MIKNRCRNKIFKTVFSDLHHQRFSFYLTQLIMALPCGGGIFIMNSAFSICRQLTREALPRLDNYRNIMSIQAANRPTLDELHNATLPNKVSISHHFMGLQEL